MKYWAWVLLITATISNAQSTTAKPCTGDNYRQFDFWIGEWDVYGINGNKAGDSKISLILDSCIILEEWVSVTKPGVFTYKGKSFNTYNSQAKQWQQLWVDNTGGSTHYLYGSYSEGKIVFQTSLPSSANESLQIDRLSFFALDTNRVRQLGEQSKDNAKSWVTKYDLEYRRKNN